MAPGAFPVLPWQQEPTTLTLSIVAPCFNKQGCFGEFLRRAAAAGPCFMGQHLGRLA
jgi:hypothetical protein